MDLNLTGTLVNLTPHEIVVRTDGAAQIIVPPSGKVARCSEVREHRCLLDVAGLGVEVTQARYGEITDLPDAEPGVFYIVSALVAQAAKRGDVLCPGPAIRDDAGRVMACNGLSACN